jgi:hypothetical protein
MSRFDRLAAENDPADAADAVRPLADALSASVRNQFWISSTRCQSEPAAFGFDRRERQILFDRRHTPHG